MVETVSIFVSSPGDVAAERVIAQTVIARLQGEFAGRLTVVPQFWEHEPLRSNSSYQDQINDFISPADAGIVVCILWKRLGSRLHPRFERRADGTAYESGTAYEFETALRSCEERGRPDLLVYRKTEEPIASLRETGRLEEAKEQWEALETYLRCSFSNDDATNRSAYHKFRTTDAFEGLLYEHLAKLLARWAAGAGYASAPVSWDRGSPFRGLHAFEFEHAAVFCGRARAVDEIRRRLLLQAGQGTAFILVYGTSGTGKSSVMRAGLLPLLVQPGVVEGVSLWRRCAFRPAEMEGDPCRALARRFLDAGMLPELSEAGIAEKELGDLFAGNPEGAVIPIRLGLSMAARKAQEGGRLAEAPRVCCFVLIDQMEELFTRPGLGQEERERFVRLLRILATCRADGSGGGNPGGNLVWIGATMRSDFYQQSQSLAGLEELLGQHGDYRLALPNAREIGDMIRLPARAAGLLFESEDGPRGQDLGSRLHDAMLRDLSALPLLEFTLQQLYERREGNLLTFAAYEAIGGIEGALGRRAEEIFSGLPGTVRGSLPAVLRCLAEPQEGRNGESGRPAACTVPLSTFPEGTPERALVDAFLAPDARLLSAQGDDEGASLRVVHEALFSHWPRARRQLEEDRDRHRTLARVKAARKEWEEGGRHDDFLLPPGGRLSEAVALLRDWPRSVQPSDVDFVRRSERRERAQRRKRERRLAGLSAVFAVLAAAAGLAGLFADARGKEASDNAGLAYEVLDTLVTDVADRMRTASGIPAAFRQSVLGGIEASFGRFDGAKAREEGIAASLRRFTLDGIEAVFGPGAGREQASGLERQRMLGLVALSEAYQALGNLSGAETKVLAALAIGAGYSAGADETGSWRAAMAAARQRHGDVLMEMRSFAAAETEFEQAHAIRAALNDERPGDAAAQRALATGCERLGDVYRRRSRSAEAERMYDRSLDLREALVAREPGNTDWRRDLSIAYERKGDLLAAKRDDAGALDAYRRMLGQRLELHKGNRGNTEWQLDVVAAYDKVGDVLRSMGRPGEARDVLVEAERIARLLVRQDPENADWRRSLAVTLHRSAGVSLDLGAVRLARDTLDEAAGIMQALRETDPANAQWRRDHAQILIRMGDVHAKGNRLPAARKAYQEGREIGQQGRADDEQDWEWRRDLAAGYERMGNLERQGGDHAGAAESYRKAVDLIAGYAAGDAGRLDWLLDMILLRQKLAEALGDMTDALGDKADPRRRADAVAMAARAVEESRELAGNDPERPAWRAALASSLNLHAWLVATGHSPEPKAVAAAVRQAEEALALSDGPVPEYLDTLAAARFAAGDVTRALRTGRTALDLCNAANPGDLTGICRQISENLRRMRANAEALALKP